MTGNSERDGLKRRMIGKSAAKLLGINNRLWYHILTKYKGRKSTVTEIWKDIEGFEGFYQISNYGRVKSLGGWCGTAKRKERIRAVHLTHDGYEKVRLIHGGKDKTVRVHRLVAEAFIPNPENKDTVNHKDGNKRNNHVSNLEWVDRSEQMIHAYKLGLKTSRVGSKNKNAKLTAEQVREIRNSYIPYSREFGTVALAKKYGVTNRVIGLIVRGKSYENVK
ncbi:NUMOD4 motif-containing HNH endonuclease [Peptococcaceae bacterium 1198_IL3148]